VPLESGNRVLTSSGTLALKRWAGLATIALAACWAFLRSGTGVMPDLQTFTAWALSWPATATEPLQEVYFSSPLGHVTAQVLQATTESRFLWLHTLTAIAAIAGLACWSYLSAGGDGRNQAARLVILTPITAILLAWLGYYDAFTVVCWVLALFAWRTGWRPLMIAAGVLLGFQHFEQAALGALAWLLAWAALRTTDAFSSHRSPAWVLLGVPLGKLALIAVLTMSGTGSDQGRLGWLTDTAMLRTTVSTAVNNGPLLLWSMFAGFWVIVIYAFLGLPGRRERWCLIAAVGLPLFMTLVTFDRPRVFALTTIPIVAMLSVVFAQEMRKQGDGRLRLPLEAIVWLGTPLIFWGQTLFNFGALDRIIVLYGALIP